MSLGKGAGASGKIVPLGMSAVSTWSRGPLRDPAGAYLLEESVKSSQVLLKMSCSGGEKQTCMAETTARLHFALLKVFFSLLRVEHKETDQLMQN